MNTEKIICSVHGEIENSLRELKNKVEKFELVTVKNGKEKKVHITELVKDIYYDVEVIRDLNKVHRIFKKYRIYFLMLLAFLFLLGINYQEILLKILK